MKKADTKEGKERWAPIEQYDGDYHISSFGRVRGIRKILTPHIGKRGYCSVQLKKHGRPKTVYVHRLVAMAFIENSEYKPEVNHKDGNRKNNHVDNLEWCTSEENYRDGLSRGGYKYVPVDVYKDGEYICTYESTSEAARQLNLHQSHISACINGKRKHVGGYFITMSLRHE